METYTPACDIYANEDFEFSAEIENEDEETGEVTISITRNPRCDACFKLEECLAKVNAVIDSAFELEEDEIGLGSSVIIH